MSVTALAEVFRSPGLRRLQLAWLLTSVGVWGAALVLAVYAYDRGGPSAVGVMALVRSLPGGPAAPLLTLWADRVSRRSVLLVSNAVRAATLAGMAVCVTAGAPLAVVYVLVAIFAAASPAYKPSQSALLPLLARTPAELSSANVAVTMLTNAGFLVGSLASGVVLAATSYETVIGGLAAAFAVSLVPLARVERDTPPEPDPDARPLGELAEGWSTIRRDREIGLLVGLGAVMMFVLGAIDVLIVVSALGFLDVGEAGAGYLNAVLGIGAVAGGFGVLALLTRGRLAAGVLVGALFLVLGGGLIWVVGSLVVVAAAMAALGSGDAFLDASIGTLLQRLTPDHVVSRVFGVVEAFAVIALALGSLVAGLLADAIGARAAFAIVGAVMAVPVLLVRARLAAFEAGAPVPGREYGLLRAHAIFAPLPVATTERLARGLEEVRPAAGTAVIEQGHVGDRFALVAEGELDVFVDGKPVRTLVSGDGFGEIALLRDIPRTATVRARDGVVLLALDRERFLAAVTGLERSQRSAAAVSEERMAAAAPAQG